jgi:hypothetical protein
MYVPTSLGWKIQKGTINITISLHYYHLVPDPTSESNICVVLHLQIAQIHTLYM